MCQHCIDGINVDLTVTISIFHNAHSYPVIIHSQAYEQEDINIGKCQLFLEVSVTL